MIFSTHRYKTKSSHNAHKQRDYGYFIISQLSKMGLYVRTGGKGKTFMENRGQKMEECCGYLPNYDILPP